MGVLGGHRGGVCRRSVLPLLEMLLLDREPSDDALPRP